MESRRNFSNDSNSAMTCDSDGNREFSNTSSNYALMNEEDILSISMKSQVSWNTSVRSANPIPSQNPSSRIYSNDPEVSDITIQEGPNYKFILTFVPRNDETEYVNDGEAKSHSTLLAVDMNAIRKTKPHSTLLQTEKSGNAFNSAVLSKSSIAEDDAHRIQSRLTKVEMTVSNIGTTEAVSTMITVMDDDIQEYDVLSGRGGKSNNHQGNKFYRGLVNMKKQEYRLKEVNRKKEEVSQSIFNEIQSKGGRFLIQSNANPETQWHVMTFDKAKNKISQALREGGNLKWTVPQPVSGSIVSNDSVE